MINSGGGGLGQDDSIGKKPPSHTVAQGSARGAVHVVGSVLRTVPRLKIDFRSVMASAQLPGAPADCTGLK